VGRSGADFRLSGRASVIATAAVMVAAQPAINLASGFQLHLPCFRFNFRAWRCVTQRQMDKVGLGVL